MCLKQYTLFIKVCFILVLALVIKLCENVIHGHCLWSMASEIIVGGRSLFVTQDWFLIRLQWEHSGLVISRVLLWQFYIFTNFVAGWGFLTFHAFFTLTPNIPRHPLFKAPGAHHYYWHYHYHTIFIIILYHHYHLPRHPLLEPPGAHYYPIHTTI